MTAKNYYNLICSNRAKMQMIAQIMNEYLTNGEEIDKILENRDIEPTEDQIEEETYRQKNLDKIIELM